MKVITSRSKWVLILFILILVSCSEDEKTYTAVQAGNEVVDLLIAGQFQEVHSKWFDEKLKSKIPTDKLENNWKRQIDTSGEFVEVSSVQQSNQSDNYDVIEASIVSSEMTFDVRMVFNEGYQLVGFSLSDGVANVSLPDSIIEEDVIVGEHTPYELQGLLTLPKQKQVGLPAVVLVHGSGPSDMDGSAYAYKPFRDLAWGLAEQGIAVIRYDKRTLTYGSRSVQNIKDFTVFEETVEDAILATQLIREDERIDESNVYVLGHSLGGMLAPRIDVQGGEYAGIIMLAGSPRPLWEIIYDQNKTVLENEAHTEPAQQQIEAEYKKAKQLQELTDEEAKGQTVFGINGYYFKEMDKYNAKRIVSKLEKPLLIMQGEDDFQVYYEKDFAAWKDILGERENVRFISYPNLNHFFVAYQGPAKGTIAEYEKPKRVDSEVINDIASWILSYQK